MKKRLLIAAIIIAALCVSQVALISGARQAALSLYKQKAGAGLAAECGAAETQLSWRGPNSFEVLVSQHCGPKAGEGITYRMTYGFGGWSSEEIEHWVV